MLFLAKGNTSDHVVLTLTEKVSLVNAYYLFVISHITTKEVIRFIKSNADDLSAYKSRYNEFVINTSVLFATASVGQWIYKVYEQASAINTDETGLKLLETGKLNYLSDTQFTYKKYEPLTGYKAYGG
jgi:hypothetical protein